MFLKSCIAALVAASTLLVSSAAPAADGTMKTEPDLRLIKTSEADPGTWVTEEEKIEKYVSKKTKFIDITEITVSLAPLIEIKDRGN